MRIICDCGQVLDPHRTDRGVAYYVCIDHPGGPREMYAMDADHLGDASDLYLYSQIVAQDWTRADLLAWIRRTWLEYRQWCRP